MSKAGESPNTRSGGQPASRGFRQIVADPTGNREQRRAAKRMARGQHQAGVLIVSDGPAENNPEGKDAQ